MAQYRWVQLNIPFWYKLPECVMLERLETPPNSFFFFFFARILQIEARGNCMNGAKQWIKRVNKQNKKPIKWRPSYIRKRMTNSSRANSVDRLRTFSKTFYNLDFYPHQLHCLKWEITHTLSIQLNAAITFCQLDWFQQSRKYHVNKPKIAVINGF